MDGCRKGREAMPYVVFRQTWKGNRVCAYTFIAKRESATDARRLAADYNYDTVDDTSVWYSTEDAYEERVKRGTATPVRDP
jgi:hypothetical protein